MRLSSLWCYLPQIDELKPFEDDMAKLFENVEFRRSHNSFQNILKRDIANIRGSQVIFMPADKTSSLYWLKKAQYVKVVTGEYNESLQVHRWTYDDVNAEAQVIASKFGIADRMDTMAKTQAFITLKDHKIIL